MTDDVVSFMIDDVMLLDLEFVLEFIILFLLAEENQVKKITKFFR